MFVESVPEEPDVVLISRPGVTGADSYLGFSSLLGTGASNIKNRGMFFVDGVLNNDIFALTSDNKLYKTVTNIGTIDGSGVPSWGAYADHVFVTSGSSLWMYDGTTLSSVATPGSFSVKALCVGASHLIVIDSGTGKFFWSDALGTTLPSLNFATAENSPDDLVDCLYVGDTLILFGTETVELWPSTGDATAPFQPLVGKAFTVGCRATGCATAFNKTFAWITDHNNICLTDQTNVISHPGIEEKLAISSGAYLWTFWLEGTEFLAVRLDNNTFVYSAKSQLWSEFQTGGGNWLPNNYDKGLFGGGGQYLVWLDNTYTSGPYSGDLGATTFERRFRAGVPLTTGSLTVDNLTLRVNEGYTPVYSAGKPIEFQNPMVQMRTSNDGGNNWSAWQQRSLGANGSYRKPPTWRALGMFGFPGFMVEIQVTDRVPFRVSGAKINEPYGSR
jgi:hypothetical protein